MTEPVVSIKMITYNHAPFIAQAIEGVIQQKTNFPFELVIGEDCSTDGTREIVFKYQREYPDIIRVITSDKNVGMKKNGLRTLNACRGKYIAFCEGDDHWHHRLKLQKQVDYLESHPECGLVYSSFDVYHVKSRKRIENYIVYRKWQIPENPSISDVVEGNSKTLTCTVMIRRALYKQIVESDLYLHQNEHFLMGDTQVWAELATKARLYYIPESMATYNITEESATRNSDVKKELRFSMSNAELLLYLCDKHNLPKRLRTKYEKYYAASALRLAFHSMDSELADEVRRKSEAFTCREWLLYLGAKKSMIHYPFRLVAAFQRLFREKNSQWM